jgi:hypothetical protein
MYAQLFEAVDGDNVEFRIFIAILECNLKFRRIVVGTPDGAAAMRRVLMRLKSDPSVWLADTAAILKAADGK